MGEMEKMNRKNQQGVSIIAAIFIIVVLGFMGVMFVSLIGTGSFSSVNDLQSAQALYLADGGLQYTLALNKNNMPNYSTNGVWINLGAGQFKVDTMSYLTATFNANDATMTVDSTAGFPITGGRLTINSDFDITYTGTTPTSFTGILPIPHEVHNFNGSVYPATRFSGFPAALPNNCNPVAIIPVDNDTGGFQIPGIIFIDTEYLYCSGPPAANQFRNCQRCYANSSPAPHPQGRFFSQYILTSTGRIPGISGTVERIVQVNSGPYEL
jgi:hypothetical protein